jgi:hypothetical protein
VAAKKRAARAKKRTPKKRLSAKPKGRRAHVASPSLEERNKALARSFLEAVSRADTDAIVAAYAPDGICWTAGTMPISGSFGVEQIAAASLGVLGAFPKGLAFTLHALTAEGDRVAIEAESRGEHVSGKLYNNKYHFLMRVRDGKIAEWREYMDTMHANDVLCGGA